MPKKETITIHVSFVNEDTMKGNSSQITLDPKLNLSIKDARSYITEQINKQEPLKILIKTAKVTSDEITKTPIEIRQTIMGCFSEDDLPNCPLVTGTHVIFLLSRNAVE